MRFHREKQSERKEHTKKEEEEMSFISSTEYIYIDYIELQMQWRRKKVARKQENTKHCSNGAEIATATDNRLLLLRMEGIEGINLFIKYRYICVIL